jgi:putative membrane-bound dehydrogenase-like protein
MTVAGGFQVALVACEPAIRKPVAIEFDERGRLWVVQYLQYPNPAGLKRVAVDRYSRTVYDRIPEPPPRGPKGADRITILEPTLRNGKRQVRAKDFVGGLNLATGIAFGHGGVFVLQAPYLLFYPDRDRDDVPDGDPEVLLSGFGMEDAHSVANSLTWGPDGWLYGCQGSTVTAHVRGIEFQQGVWRYHPITHRFDLFCEGGGNSWGLDFDRHGELFYSTNVGGFVTLHGAQGGYYWKQFGKHGALHNPYTYGYFEHVPHRNFRGGHVTVGGIVYEGDSFPARFRGKYIAADLLGHAVNWHDLESWGSTFRSRHGGELLLANDTWFAPSDVTLGPDGAVYVADWHDKRTAHPDPDADWDRTGGRIYRIQATGSPSPMTPLPQGERGDFLPPSPLGGEGSGVRGKFDLAQLPSAKLVTLLSHPNDWYVRTARRILAERRDPEVVFPLRILVLESKDDHLVLEALWALHVSGGLDEYFAGVLLGHRNPDVRRWTVRLIGDEERVPAALAHRLVDLAATEPDVTVRRQLACTARRLPASPGLDIAQRLLKRNLDGQDAYIPLLLWWAVERHAVTALDQVLDRFGSAAAWHSPMVRDVILERLMRRYAAEGTSVCLAGCACLLASAPAQGRDRTLTALDQGLQERAGRPAPAALGTLFDQYAVARHSPEAPVKGRLLVSAELERQVRALWTDDTADVPLIRVAVRLGWPAAEGRALALAGDGWAPPDRRLALLQLLGEAGTGRCVEPLLKMIDGADLAPVRLAALVALQHFDQGRIAAALLRLYPRLTGGLRSRVADVLLGRRGWALRFLRAVDAGKLPAADITVEQLRPVAQYHDTELNRLVRRHWGNIQGGTPEEKLAEMRRLSNDLRAGTGDPLRGRAVFQKHCATCHRLFDEGNAVGPDLTHANRKDRDFLLASIVDPSAVIRKEYLSYTVQTTDGRLLTGLIAAQTAGSITLLNARNERTVVPRVQIESVHESPVSLMPEDLLKGLKPQDVRALFRYLQHD